MGIGGILWKTARILLAAREIKETLDNYGLLPEGRRIRYYNDERTIMGESPFWSERYNAFFWTDWYDSSIRKMDFDTKEITKIPLLDTGKGKPVVKSFGEAIDGSFIAAFGSQGIGSIELISQDGQLVGQTTLLSDEPLAEKPDTVIMNDGKVSPDGKFYAGQMYLDGIVDLATASVLNPNAFAFVGSMDNGGILQSLVYSWDGQELSTLTDYGYHMVTNGQAWSEDGNTYFVCDTILNQVTAFDYDPISGAVSNGRLLITNEEGGNLDGASVDKFGYYWAAQNFGEGKVLKFDTETGKNVGSIQLKAGSTVSSLAFGGPNYKTMLVTTG